MGNAALDIETRIWNLESYVDPETKCWVAGGYLHRGYKSIHMVGRKNKRLHRVSYEHYIGPIPEGLQLDHVCRNTACCNPRHLDPVTAAENTLRSRAASALNAAKTHCKRGHEFTEENTLVRIVRGAECRRCITCESARKRDARAKAGANTRGCRKERKASGLCFKGHPINEQNSGYRSTTGRFFCKACAREHAKAKRGEA